MPKAGRPEAKSGCAKLNVSLTASLTATGTVSFTDITATGTATGSTVQTTGGTTGSVINGGTVDITVPNGNSFLSLQPVSSLPNGGMYALRQDQSTVNNVVVGTALVGGGSLTVAGQTNTTIRITNSTGVTTTFRYGFIRIGVPAV